jgi:hypothetical protein
MGGPYRKQTKTYLEYDVQVTSEYYMECHGTECPFYSKSVDNLTQKEYEECLRALKEI